MAGNGKQADDPKLDQVDLQIIALRSANPKITFRDLAEQTGVSPTTAWRRLQAIAESDWILSTRNQFPQLIALAYDVLERALLNDDLAVSVPVALDIAHGLGILKHRHEFTGADGGPIRTQNLHVYIPDNGRDNAEVAVVPIAIVDDPDLGNGNGSNGNGNGSAPDTTAA